MVRYSPVITISIAIFLAACGGSASTESQGSGETPVPPEQSDPTSEPIEPAPVDSAPVEPAPVDSAPVEPAPVDPAPVEPAPVDSAPVEPAPVDAAPVEPVPEGQAIDESLGSVINLRGVVYNNTEIEIFWDRSPVDVIAYRIARNGKVLASFRDGLSYYDNSVEPGESYTYEVTPLGVDDSIGVVAQILLITPPSLPEISAINVIDVFSYLISLASTDAIAVLLTVPPPEPGGTTETERGPNGEETIYACTHSGRITTLRNDVIPLPTTSIKYEDCKSSETHAYTLISGLASTEKTMSKNVWNIGFGSRSAWRDFSVLKSDQNVIEFSGSVRNFDGLNEDYNSWELKHSATAFEGKTMLAVETTITSGTGSGQVRVPFTRDWSLDLSVQSPIINNRRIVLKTEKPFTSSNTEGCFDMGQLVAIAIDGSRLEVDADTGNIETFFLDAVVDGEIFRQELFWQEHVLSNDLLADACG